MTTISELPKKAWYRFFVVLLNIFSIVLFIATIGIWYLLASQKTYDATNAYFMCNGDPSHYSLTDGEKAELSGVNGATLIEEYPDNQLLKDCGGGSTLNYTIGGMTSTQDWLVWQLLLTLFIEWIAIVVIHRVFVYIFAGSIRFQD